MSNHKGIQEVSIEEVPEVLEFMDAQTRLEEFRARQPQLMAEFEHLIAEYNTAREAADLAVRQRGVNCGPWKQLSPQVKYDAEKLYSAVGREDFVRLGGIVRTTTEYVIDRATIEAAIAANRVPQQIIDLVRTVTRKYGSVPKGELP